MDKIVLGNHIYHAHYHGKLIYAIAILALVAAIFPWVLLYSLAGTVNRLEFDRIYAVGKYLVEYQQVEAMLEQGCIMRLSPPIPVRIKRVQSKDE